MAQNGTGVFSLFGPQKQWDTPFGVLGKEERENGRTPMGHPLLALEKKNGRVGEWESPLWPAFPYMQWDNPPFVAFKTKEQRTKEGAFCKGGGVNAKINARFCRACNF